MTVAHCLCLRFSTQASYIPFTAICYWVFGSKAASPILNNLDNGFVKASSIIAILVNVIISYPVVLKAVEDAVEVSFGTASVVNTVVSGSCTVTESDRTRARSCEQVSGEIHTQIEVRRAKDKCEKEPRRKLCFSEMCRRKENV